MVSSPLPAVQLAPCHDPPLYHSPCQTWSVVHRGAPSGNVLDRGLLQGSTQTTDSTGGRPSRHTPPLAPCWTVVCCRALHGPPTLLVAGPPDIRPPLAPCWTVVCCRALHGPPTRLAAGPPDIRPLWHRVGPWSVVGLYTDHRLDWRPALQTDAPSDTVLDRGLLQGSTRTTDSTGGRPCRCIAASSSSSSARSSSASTRTAGDRPASITSSSSSWTRATISPTSSSSRYHPVSERVRPRYPMSVFVTPCLSSLPHVGGSVSQYMVAPRIIGFNQLLVSFYTRNCSIHLLFSLQLFFFTFLFYTRDRSIHLFFLCSFFSVYFSSLFFSSQFLSLPRSELIRRSSLQAAAFFAVIWATSVVCFMFSSYLHVPVFSNPLWLVSFCLLYLINPLRVLHYRARRWLLRVLVSRCRTASVL